MENRFDLSLERGALHEWDPEEQALKACRKLPERHLEEFLTSWHFLRATPFWPGLYVGFYPEWEAITASLVMATNIATSRSITTLLNDPQITPFYHVMTYDHLVSFLKGLAKAQWPAQRFHISSVSFSHFPGTTEVHILVEPATQARAREIVKRRMCQGCVQFYFEKGKVTELSSADLIALLEEFVVETNRYIPKKSFEAIERTPIFQKLKNYLIGQNYIDETYRPRRKIATVERAIDRWFACPPYCPICGSEIKNRRRRKTTCGDQNCRQKKKRVKNYIEGLLARENLDRQQVIERLNEHERNELRIGKKYHEYRKIYDVPLLVNLILSELPPPVEEL